MPEPLLLIVAGPPGVGKTTFSRRLGDALGLPVVCRDSIKEGVAYTTGQVVENGSPEAARLFGLFYEVVDQFLDRGISLVAEAAFRASLAPEELARRACRARLVLIRCVAPSAVWFDRFQLRGRRPGHRDHDFVARTLSEGGPDSTPYLFDVPGVPTFELELTSDDPPPLDAAIDFLRSA